MVFIFVIFLFFEECLCKNKNNSTSSDLCTLTGEYSKDPFPSLTKCYRFNNNACCTSVHDDYINTSLENLLTTSCMRKYNELEELMCLGCHPYESSYIERASKKLYICHSFAMKFWNASDIEELEKPTRKYDNCGFKITDYLSPFATRNHYIIPSETFTGFLDMINKIKIPFYEDYQIILIDENAKDAPYCFNYSSFLKVFLYQYLLALFSFYFLCCN